MSDTQTTATAVEHVKRTPAWQSMADDAIKTWKKFNNHIKAMVERDANESDTRLIVTDFLTDVLGFDKYSDLTTEYQTRGEFADYGLRIDEQLVAMVEVKRAAQKLTERHLRQVESYGLKEGVEWLLLTNGNEWRVYHLSSDGVSPVKVDLAFMFVLTEGLTKAQLAQVSTLHKQYWKRGALDAEWSRLTALSPKNLTNILRSERVLNAIRIEVKSQSNHTATNEDVAAAVRAAFGNGA